MFVIHEPCRGVEDWYAACYEYHAEEEQLARAKGEEADEKKHHEAVTVLVRALVAETVKA